MLLQLLLFALSCAVALAELPWPHLYRDTRALLPSDLSLLSVSSNVSASVAAIDPTHARVMQPLLQQLHSDSVVWDIGADIGTVSLHAARRGARVFAFEWDPVLLQDLRASAPRNSLSGKDHCCHRVPVCIFRQRCRLPPPASQRHERRCELHLAALNTCNDPPPRPPQPGIFRERNSTFSQQEEVELHLQPAHFSPSHTHSCHRYSTQSHLHVIAQPPFPALPARCRAIVISCAAQHVTRRWRVHSTNKLCMRARNAAPTYIFTEQKGQGIERGAHCITCIR